MSVKQYGGRLNCGISDDAPSILLLGHGCEDINKIFDIPEGFVYVTRAICGQAVTTELFYHEIVGDFFNNTPFFNSPCKNYSLSKKYNALDNDTDYHSLLNFHYKKSPIESGRTCPDFKFWPLTNFINEEKWYSYKSGVYINTNDNSNYSSHPVVSITKRNDKFVITEEQIRKIYEGSIAPDIDIIISRLKLLKAHKSSDEPEGEYDTKHLQLVIDKISIMLTTLINKLYNVYHLTEAIIFNPLCRKPCKGLPVIHSNVMRRRADSLTTINTHDEMDKKTQEEEEDITQFLGGKEKHNRIKRRNTKRRNTKQRNTKQRNKKIKQKNKTKKYKREKK